MFGVLQAVRLRLVVVVVVESRPWMVGRRISERETLLSEERGRAKHDYVWSCKSNCLEHLNYL
jgi:hypothetical protein